MTSIFQRAMGDDFARLHPALQRRFGIGLDTGEACIGTGVMDRIWNGGAFTRPFLALGATRHILFPEVGYNVPFTIGNYPYLDSFGRETVTFARAFRLPRRTRRFDATMVYSAERGCLVDYLGTHQHLATELRFAADGRGGLVIRSGPFRFTEGPVGVRVPAILTGTATVHEWYDERESRFRIEVRVVNRRFGPLFGYKGTFMVRYVPGTDLPATVKPRREVARC